MLWWGCQMAGFLEMMMGPARLSSTTTDLGARPPTGLQAPGKKKKSAATKRVPTGPVDAQKPVSGGLRRKMLTQMVKSGVGRK